eukprot:Nk52_evm1s2191 gene=Nk52_evmTU1s2191
MNSKQIVSVSPATVQYMSGLLRSCAGVMRGCEGKVFSLPATSRGLHILTGRKIKTSTSGTLQQLSPLASLFASTPSAPLSVPRLIHPSVLGSVRGYAKKKEKKGDKKKGKGGNVKQARGSWDDNEDYDRYGGDEHVERTSGHEDVTRKIEEYTSGMDDALKRLEMDFANLNAGRAQPDYLDHVKVNAYESVMPLNKVASVALKDPSNLIIKVFDEEMVPAVTEAIRATQMDLTVRSSGTKGMIMVNVPKVTKEHRASLQKMAKKAAEECKNKLRKGRQTVLHGVKAAGLSKDDAASFQKDIEVVQKTYIKNVDEALKRKEAELML